MTRVLALLRKPVFGAPVWRWLACLVLAAGAAFLFRSWFASAWGLLALLRFPGPPATYDTPDDAARARDALRAHSAAQEADSALRDVALAERAAGDAGRQAAASDPLDVVAARVERRARERKP